MMMRCSPQERETSVLYLEAQAVDGGDRRRLEEVEGKLRRER
jgi:hypothetical protein